MYLLSHLLTVYLLVVEIIDLIRQRLLCVSDHTPVPLHPVFAGNEQVVTTWLTAHMATFQDYPRSPGPRRLLKQKIAVVSHSNMGNAYARIYRGQDLENRGYRVIPTEHPSYAYAEYSGELSRMAQTTEKQSDSYGSGSGDLL